MRKGSLLALVTLPVVMATGSAHAGFVYDLEGTFTETERYGLDDYRLVPMPADPGDRFTGTVTYTPDADVEPDDGVIENALTFSFQFNGETVSGPSTRLTTGGGDLHAFEEHVSTSYSGDFRGESYYAEDIEWPLGTYQEAFSLPSAGEMGNRLAQSEFDLLWVHNMSSEFGLHGRVDSASLRQASVPTPGTFGLLAGGLVFLGLTRRHK